MGWDGWDGMNGMGWMVIIGHRYSKSTFGANRYEIYENDFSQTLL